MNIFSILLSPKKYVFFKSCFLLFCSYILFALFKLMLSKIFPSVLNSDYTQSAIQEMLNSEPLRAAVMIGISAPIFEEMMFRTLIKPTHTDLVLFLTSWPVFLTSYFIPAEVHWFFKLVFIAIFLSCFTYVGVQLINPYKVRHLRTWLSRNYKLLWVLSSFAFGLIHITNYVDVFIINLPLFLHIVPRILAGFFFGYIKIKNKNLGWSMALHSLNNAVPLLLLLIFRQH